VEADRVLWLCSESSVRISRMTHIYCNPHIGLYLVWGRQQWAAKCLIELLHRIEVVGYGCDGWLVVLRMTR
jgi:hypothetical protein